MIEKLLAACLLSMQILSAGLGTPNNITETADGSRVLHFVDVFGEKYETTVLEKVDKNPYLALHYFKSEEQLRYEDDLYISRLGIDVSKYQSSVNWAKVKDAGYEFTFIRLGFRGYGQAGNIKLDQKFEEHFSGASQEGLDVGVYFFSQAINEAEAVEEAEFVIKQLGGRDLQLPIVYDPESILDDVARTDDVTAEQFTKNTIAFCDAIAAAGYKPMVYCNMLWEAFQLDLSQLTNYPIWYADYEPVPQTPYKFEFWQYTNTGRVPGIAGEMDINIQMIKKDTTAN